MSARPSQACPNADRPVRFQSRRDGRAEAWPCNADKSVQPPIVGTSHAAHPALPGTCLNSRESPPGPPSLRLLHPRHNGGKGHVSKHRAAGCLKHLWRSLEPRPALQDSRRFGRQRNAMQAACLHSRSGDNPKRAQRRVHPTPSPPRPSALRSASDSAAPARQYPCARQASPTGGIRQGEGRLIVTLRPLCGLGQQF